MDIIVDIDGTLADCTHRLHFIQNKPKNWPAFFDACGDDKPIWPVVHMVRALWLGGDEQRNRLAFCSGRPERTRRATTNWLGEHLGLTESYIRLFMRADGDFRADDVVKLELLKAMRDQGHNPTLAIDDRKRVVDMWRAQGILCAQVADGEF